METRSILFRFGLACAVVWLLVQAASAGSISAPPTPASTPALRHVILMIGDGLGFSHIALARRAALGAGGRFAFERLGEVGIVTTESGSNAVTDSGAAATAFGAGVKTGNRVVGIDRAERPVKTLGDLAHTAGWSVGYVTTTRITHATPAAFYAHQKDRDAECDIAPQLFLQAPEVAIGGGLTFFDPESPDCKAFGRDERGDLLERASQSGYDLWLRGGSPPPANPRRKLLGLLSRSHLAYQLDDAGIPEERRDPSLAALTETALAHLYAEGRPFFLLVEGGRIDHAGHSFDAAGVVAETVAFDEAVKVVARFLEQQPNTLVVLTADHATGALGVQEFTDWPALDRQTASVDAMAAQIRDAGAGFHELAQWTGYSDWKAEELDAVRATANIYEARRRLGRALGDRQGVTWSTRVLETTEATKGHTGEDVPLYAAGQGAERFRGVLDNTDIPQRIAALLGWQLSEYQPTAK
jgi:alkaline phosphatase